MAPCISAVPRRNGRWCRGSAISGIAPLRWVLVPLGGVCIADLASSSPAAGSTVRLESRPMWAPASLSPPPLQLGAREGPATRAARTDSQLERRLGSHPFLTGKVYRVGEQWTCGRGCAPPHEKKEVYASVDQVPRDHENCTELQWLHSLRMQVDVDAWCTGLNHTCDELERNQTLRDWKFDLYRDCNQDEDLLNGECTLECRFNKHVYHKCVHTYDRLQKFGLHGGLGLDVCVVVKWCLGNSTAEANELHCNKSEVPADDNVIQADQAEGISVVMILLLVVAGLVCVIACLVTVVLRQRMLARKASAAASGAAEQNSGGASNGMVVVGRPISAEAANAGGTVAAGAATGPRSDKGKGDQ
eukprot:TRINITY_DN18242_c0_g1_i1.p1 TRINITY_DN18242_c0_g1~~TRINITY_DN18242_c0_g1_i1.p1  ORF type:complete len:379 (+),score=68.93 TRINITY_DN18242_c0_g1_i1:59-1138(+)